MPPAKASPNRSRLRQPMRITRQISSANSTSTTSAAHEAQLLAEAREHEVGRGHRQVVLASAPPFVRPLPNRPPVLTAICDWSSW